ncbi:hypothetical protein P4O66_022165 [Electrophorus voltai]|uniref:Uncharacterized protein n=1 Tax=Electrophorus voltai TaxID=2609070 RepID=A0AAD8YMN2_9TELE|nr:hypothetical protein P4O66_022165 [Electrophorus voltai]
MRRATERSSGGAGVHKPQALAPDMDNESQYSGYSYKSSHSRSSRKHRDRRDRHRSKSRDSRGDKSVTIQAPGEALLDTESTRGDDRVRVFTSYLVQPGKPFHYSFRP